MAVKNENNQNLKARSSGNCLKCGGEMEDGVLNIPVADELVGWGINKKKLGFIDIQEKKKMIQSFRCKTCGYLENYANK